MGETLPVQMQSAGEDITEAAEITTKRSQNFV